MKRNRIEALGPISCGDFRHLREWSQSAEILFFAQGVIVKLLCLLISLFVEGLALVREGP